MAKAYREVAYYELLLVHHQQQSSHGFLKYLRQLRLIAVSEGFIRLQTICQFFL